LGICLRKKKRAFFRQIINPQQALRAFPYGSGYSLQWLAFMGNPFPLLSLTQENLTSEFKTQKKALKIATQQPRLKKNHHDLKELKKNQKNLSKKNRCLHILRLVR
jgi:hypothetical protein